MHVLVYSPFVFGHPQIYCQVFVRLLTSRGCRVTLLVGMERPEALAAWPDLDRLTDDPAVSIRACPSGMRGRSLSSEELLEAQESAGADAILFIDGDLSKDEFTRIANGKAPRLRGPVVAIFARTAPWYPGEHFYSGERLDGGKLTLRGALGKMKRRLLHRRDSPRHFFEHVLLRRRAVDVLLVKDERITEKFGPPVVWLPEIYRAFDRPETEDEQMEFEQVAQVFSRFLEQQSGREVLLFFGRGAWYKGYDFFLELLRRDPAACGVHFGEEALHEPARPFAFDVDALRRGLLEQGRLFETRRYVHGQRLVELGFSAARRMVSTHRLTGSSGTVLQALELGKPVLVPAPGLLGHRVRTAALGRCYRYGDMDDLERRWREFRTEDPAAYAPAIRSFMDRFAPARVGEAVDRAFGMTRTPLAAAGR
jgi:glycosyltransferase involved in cell wall biosynthesis